MDKLKKEKSYYTPALYSLLNVSVCMFADGLFSSYCLKLLLKLYFFSVIVRFFFFERQIRKVIQSLICMTFDSPTHAMSNILEPCRPK